MWGLVLPSKEQRSSSVVLFFRVPELGRVKKRLERSIGAELTLKLYETLLNHCLNTLFSLKKKYPQVLLVGAYRGSCLPPEIANYFDLLYEQKGLTIGEDLYTLSKELFTFHRVESLLIFGSDCPEITTDFLELALAKLSENQAVLSPSHDGGYNLIGFRQEVLPYLGEIFLDIPWGTEAVLKETMKRLSVLGIKVFLLPQTVDIDTVEDLERLNFYHLWTSFST